MKCKVTEALVLVLSILIAGCAGNPLNPRNDYTGSLAGTASGATLGAGTAWALGGSKAIIGVGALTGAAVGYYVSSLRFASSGVIQGCGQVFTLGCYVTIDLPSDRLFDVNSAEFLDDACPILNSVVAILNRYPNNNIIISGNMSGFNSAKFEQRLSEERARQIAGFLWSHGINNFQYQSINHSRILSYAGYGNYFPIANDLSNNCIRRNSHIQITAYPTIDQLKIEKRYRIFNNIGDLAEPSLRCPPRYGDEFSDCQ